MKPRGFPSVPRVCNVSYLTGERTPHKDPNAKGAFIGLSLRHTRAHMARAVLEGVAFGMRDSLEIIREMGVTVSEIRASGGGARSALWQQILADTGNAPMVTINADEGPAYGAAILSSVAAGMYSTVEEGCDAIIREVSRRNPEPAAVKAYEPWYQEFRAAYTACAPGFKRVAALL